MKTAILFILFSGLASANTPKTANFFEVDTTISDIRPEKQVAEEYRKRNTLKPADQSRRAKGTSAADQMNNARNINPSL